MFVFPTDFSIWNLLRLIAFDNPRPSPTTSISIPLNSNTNEHDHTYETRYKTLHESVGKDCIFISVTFRLRCKDRSCITVGAPCAWYMHDSVPIHFDARWDMVSFTNTIIGAGGEGSMLRKPNSLYENGRSHSVLKYKVFIFIIQRACRVYFCTFYCSVAFFLFFFLYSCCWWTFTDSKRWRSASTWCSRGLLQMPNVRYDDFIRT